MTEQQETDTRPNIVLIMVDDMGFSDIGCFGPELRTPHLDALAEHGAPLTQSYNYPRRSPTHASAPHGLSHPPAGSAAARCRPAWSLPRTGGELAKA